MKRTTPDSVSDSKDNEENLSNKKQKTVMNCEEGVQKIDKQLTEQELREQLAAAYRLVDRYGWGDLIYNHLTVRIPTDDPDPSTHQFLINPFGLLFNEITASSLVKIDTQGNIIDSGSTTYGVNSAGFVIHGCVHEARLDLNCVMHCHSNAGAGVSAQKWGLLPTSLNANIVGDVTYHDYEGIVTYDDEKVRIVQDLGATSKNMILRNHGLLCCGTTIPEAFFNLYMLNKACEIQIAALSAGYENLILPKESAVKSATEIAASFNPEGVGQKEFAALLRTLDNSYKK